MRTSLFVHGVIVALAMLPFLKEKEWNPELANHMVEIEFVHADISSGAASEAPDKVEMPEPEEVKEVVEKAVVVPPVESAPILTDEAEAEIEVKDIPENNADEIILEDVVEEVPEVKEETAEVEEVIEEAADGDKGEGDKGKEITGKELGKMDFDGEGVFGRKVIYRADVKKIAEKEGKVVINLCINRVGLVTHVAFNREASTINDSKYVKRAMDVASDYLFEKDYTAPATQCGKLSFIFHIE